MSGSEIKVTDKRMFTEDGDLREEFEFLDEKAAADPASAQTPPPGAEGGPSKAREGRNDEGAAAQRPAASAPDESSEPLAAESSATGSSATGSNAAQQDSAQSEYREGAPVGGIASPGIVDIVGLLAEPAALFLGDAQGPDGQSLENPPQARPYIDLLEVLKEKTAGNVSEQEAALMEDLLYRLRMRYVEKTRGGS